MRIDELDETQAAHQAPDVSGLVRALYDEHARGLHTYLDRRVGRDLADDLLADTFRIAIEDWGSYDPTVGSERNWLYGIATNLVRRHWRSGQRRRAALDRLVAQPSVLDDPLQSPAGTAAAHLDAATDMRRLLEALDSLDHDDYELLVLTAWESMSSADAPRCSVSPGERCALACIASADNSTLHDVSPRLRPPNRKVTRHELPRRLRTTAI